MNILAFCTETWSAVLGNPFFRLFIAARHNWPIWTERFSTVKTQSLSPIRRNTSQIGEVASSSIEVAVYVSHVMKPLLPVAVSSICGSADVGRWLQCGSLLRRTCLAHKMLSFLKILWSEIQFQIFKLKSFPGFSNLKLKSFPVSFPAAASRRGEARPISCLSDRHCYAPAWTFTDGFLDWKACIQISCKEDRAAPVNCKSIHLESQDSAWSW